MRSAIWVGTLAAALAVSAAPALADDASGARFAATTLDLTGHGEARLPPDLATIDLGVTTAAPTAAEAMAQNAAAMGKVIAAVKAKGIDERSIATSTLSLAPQYAYPQGQPQQLTGYQASNRITVTLADLARVGPVVDAAVGAGANDAGQISFGLKSRAAAENFARLAAVKALEDKAQVMADAAGYHIRRLVNLSETSSEAAPQPRVLMAMMKPAAATPVEGGEIVVSVDVSGEFELTH
ncbi:MAG TPA: SIMPL domain-containing protein [Caulobacteraceae bacterium]|nr:SIMPL domain-containing protein [Caulobacteraceae bacterium]